MQLFGDARWIVRVVMMPAVRALVDWLRR
jgi:hypothetical protein